MLTEKLLGLSTACDWSVSGSSSKLELLGRLVCVAGVQKGPGSAQHMLLLKVRDAQSKTPERNNTHVCWAEFNSAQVCKGNRGPGPRGTMSNHRPTTVITV